MGTVFWKTFIETFFEFFPLQILEIQLFWISVIFLNVEKDQKEPIQKIRRPITPNVQLNQELTNAQLNNFLVNQENVFTGIFTFSRVFKKEFLKIKLQFFSKYVCDGSPDCSNGFDEENCLKYTSFYTAEKGFKLRNNEDIGKKHMP